MPIEIIEAGIDWEFLRNVRDAINKELEKLRKEKIVGSGLDAEIDLYANAKNCMQLIRIEDELKFLLGTSRADLHNDYKRPGNANETTIPGLWAIIKASEHPKCARCWHRSPEVSINREKNPTDMSGNKTGICYRCTDILNGKDENRKYL